MDRASLIREIKNKKSFLCVGLDTDLNKIPTHLQDAENPIFAFNKEIIDATKDYAVAYKLNIAFYESLGIKGWEALQKTIDYIPENCFTIADAKRGDIGNTAEMYAKTFFNTYAFDSVTVAPYMGKDSVQPFLDFANKWTILLGLTSNPGSKDFQLLETEEGPLYQQVLKKSAAWANEENLMYVIGESQGVLLKTISTFIKNHFILIPGVGAQGGTVKEVAEATLNEDIGILINVSRGNIYAGEGEKCADAVTKAAAQFQKEIEAFF